MPGGLSPRELAQAYRDENPGLYDDIDDADLIIAIRDEDPETYQLMDPLLEGMSTLMTGKGQPRTGVVDPPPAIPLPVLSTPKITGLDRIITTGLRVGGAIGGGIVGGAMGAGSGGVSLPVVGAIPGAVAGASAGGAVGSGLGETGAEWYEKATGLRGEMSPGAIAWETGLGAVTPAARGVTVAGRMAHQAAVGSGLGGVGTVGRSLIEQGELPTLRDTALNMGIGAVVGGGLQGGVEGGNATRSLGGLGEGVGSMPVGPPRSTYAGPPPPPPGQAELFARAAYRAKEQQLGQDLVVTFGEQALTGKQADFQTTLQAKRTLRQMADLTEEQQTLQASLNEVLATSFDPPTSSPYAPAGGAQRLLDRGDFSDPNLQDLVGYRPPAPELLEQFGGQLEQTLGQPPGDPRLLHQTALHLTPPPAPPPPPSRGTGQPSLLPRGRRRPPVAGALRQTSKMGGSTATLEQPRLPGVETPLPLPPRPYATGPNAGPRRAGEAHGTPRSIKYQVIKKVPVVIDGTTYYNDKITYEYEPSTLPADDPATWPAEVRREVARMAQELEEFPFTPRTWEWAPVGENYNPDDYTAAGGGARIHSGGAGAPVYDDIKLGVGGRRSHATRDDVLTSLRNALQEGKGTALSDSAAQVARARLSGKRALQDTGFTDPLLPPGAGDRLIRWIDEDGIPFVPDEEADEFTRAAREMDDGEMRGFLRRADQMEAEGVPEGVQPFFAAARQEAVRRGLIDPQQGDLRMEGPGGAGGLRLFDFEGGPPPKPPADQPSLPGTEGVRDQSIPTPEVAEAPFALSPPPAKPDRMTPTGSVKGELARFFEGEEGTVILPPPVSGDRDGLKKWLKKHEDEYGGEAWFSRVEQAMEDGDWTRAWKAAAAASVRSSAQALSAAATPKEREGVRRSLRGTALQDDLNTSIIAQARKESGLGTAPPVKGMPPSSTVSQAGAARAPRATIGPAGIINPGPPRKPLAPSQRAHTLPRTLVETVIAETDPSLVHIIPGNEDSTLRLYRQIADLAFAGQNTRELKRYLDLSDQEIGQHTIVAVQEAARMLQRLSAFRSANDAVLTEAAEAMSMGGALRGMLGKGKRIVGARGVEVGTSGDPATIDLAATAQALVDDTYSFDGAMLANTLQQPQKVSELERIQALSYPFMLMRWRTAVRNGMTLAGRYTVDALDEALTVPLAKLMGDDMGATMAGAQFRERTTLKGKGGAMVGPMTAWKGTLEEIYNFQAAHLEQLSPQDARRTIALLTKLPATEAHFMGWMAGGEQDLAGGGSRFKLINSLMDPKVQRLLTVFNRAQEFSGRGLVFDATMRAQLRASGHDPNVLLQRSFEEIAETVGGQGVLDDMLYGATSAALEATFSGQAARQSIPGALLSAVNYAWPLKLGYPFPKFNLVAAPRWIYDHSPAALAELLRFPLDQMGFTSAGFKGGRLYRGVRAQRLQAGAIPELAGKRQQAIGQVGAAQRELLATSRELGLRTRQVKRLEGRAQQGLPEADTALEQATRARDTLLQRRGQVQGQLETARTRVKQLKAQEDHLLAVVKDAQGINAPTVPQYLARMITGTALLGAAAVIRSQSGAEGTRWYEFRNDKADGSDPDILDFRPYAPFAQYLYVADVMQDVSRFTDWAGAAEQAETDGWTNAIWDHYEGKYTRPELGAEFAKAFLSISRVAGTTLTLTDLLTQNGWPSMEDAGDAIIGTVGQFLSRFPSGAGDLKDLVAGFDPEEAKVRVTPRVTRDAPYSPLAEPIASIPYVSRIIPERISQTTGQPVTTAHPWLRMLAGVGSVPRDFITEEVRRVGVPGQSVFIGETGDYGLDKTIAETYAKVLQTRLPTILELPYYQSLRTPARQRDFLQRNVFPNLKREAMGRVRQTLGISRVTAATVQGEEARRRQRQARMVEALEQDLPQIVEVEAEPEVGGPPPAPPGAGLEGGPPPPPF